MLKNKIDLKQFDNFIYDMGSNIEKISNKDIAIIGVAVKLPRVNNINEFWDKLRNGEDFIGEIPPFRRIDIEKYTQLVRSGKYNREKIYREGAYLDNIDKFDYEFFGFSPREASLIDPNQRLFLETAWAAIEDAGYGGNKLKGSRTGIYLGYSSEAEYLRIISDIEPTFLPIASTGNLQPFITGRLAYILDLKGPNMVINTLCSSSLVAVHLACQAIRNNECSMAIVGGIRISLLPIDYVEIGIESSSARSKSFDDDADGTGGGEGVIVFLLKPLAEAVKDLDTIYAVIKGSAVNHNGRSAGLTVPSPEAQEEVICNAWKDAGIDPREITYIEAHGTGTKLGDPIEVEGITRAFRKYTTKKQFCGLGSIKSNLGHLDAAAGIAGLLKAVLALKHKEIPPSIHFKNPNRNIKFEESPVFVINKLTSWNVDRAQRICGVSSFGFSGTNCHVVLAEAPEIINQKSEEDGLNILTLSSKTITGIKKLVEQYCELLRTNNDMSLNSICYTANTGRGHYSHRLAIIVHNKNELMEKLNLLSGLEVEEYKGENIYYGFIKSDEVSEGFNNSPEKEFLISARNDITKIRKISQLYVSGVNINWEDMYTGERYRKVSLPTYPFESKRCWLQLENSSEENDETGLYHKICWKPVELEYEEQNLDGETILVFKDQKGIWDKISGKLNYSNIIEVNIGNEFVRLNKSSYSISGNEEDYIRLFQELKDKKINRIIHMSSIINQCQTEDIESLEDRLVKGVYSLFFIVKAISFCEIRRNIEIFLVSEYANKVTGEEELIIPENASLFGLSKVITAENTYLKCRCIDIDKYGNYECIIDELKCNKNDFQVSYRKKNRYVEFLDELDACDTKPDPIDLKKDGVYVISGGTGGIGLEIGKYIASVTKVNLALISRTKIPEKEKWPAILSEGKYQKLCNIIKSLQIIEKLGSRIECYTADVSNKEALQNALKKIRNELGMINGVIHCAGVSGEGILTKKNFEDFKNVLKPKVHGTKLLDQLTKIDPLDFFVMFSSGATIIGMAGRGDYVAANSYMDSYSAYRNGNGKTVTINWSGWTTVGMAAEHHTDKDGLLNVLDYKKVAKILFSILNKSISRVIVGRVNDSLSLDTNQVFIPLRLPEKMLKLLKNNQRFQTQYTSVSKGQIIDNFISDKEHGAHSRIADIVMSVMCKILGYDRLNMNDDYIRLGGDSITAITAAKEISQYTGVQVDAADILKYSVFEDFIDFLEKKFHDINRNEVAICRVEEKQQYPLSSAQKRIYISCSTEGVGTSYNMPSAFLIDGALDKQHLEECFQKLVQRHEALRTSFHISKGDIVQVIEPIPSLKITYVEIDSSQIDSFIKGFIRPFDLSKAPLIRVGLAKLSDTKHVLVFDIHHIISDGASKNILLRDFVRLYGRMDLSELKIHYRDYAQWQEKLLNSENIKKQGEYWKKVFSDKIPTLNLPLDFKRPSIRSFEGDKVECSLSSDSTMRVKELANETGVTNFMILMAVYIILLYKYTGQEDIVIGTPVSGRHYPGTEELVGMFVNTIALRYRISGYLTFSEFLSLVKENTIEAFKNQDFQFDDLVKSLNLERDISRNPIFDVMFILQNTEKSEFEIDNLKFRNYGVKHKKALFDLKLEAVEENGCFYFEFEYCKKLFKKKTIKKLANDFVLILDTVVKNCNIKISDICNALMGAR